MNHRYTVLLASLTLFACGGGEPPAKAPPAPSSNSAGSAESAEVPRSLAEDQQASMREYAKAIETAKSSLTDALAKSDCKAACDAFNSMGTATKRLCYTALTDDDQRECKDAQAQQATERERTEKNCEPCPPPPEKKRRHRK